MALLHTGSKPPTKALLIGINYDAWPVYNLSGCHADVENANTFLLKIGTKSQNIRMLTDQKNSLAPTKKAILEAFSWVKEGAKDGDVLYIHFSGHGVETDPPSDNPLARASSKSICPIDMFHAKVEDISGRWDYSNMKFVNSITGEDFQQIFGHFQNTKINLTVVYDCCHSTGAMRAIGKIGSPPETRVRGIRIPPAERNVAKAVEKKADELGTTRDSRGGLDKAYEQRYAPAELVPGYVIGFAAAQGWEPAIDARTSTGPCGAFSYYFYALLNKAAKEINGTGIIDSVNKSLKANHYTQTPSITTSKELANAPLFADLTQQNATRALGVIAKLSIARSIDVPEMLQNEEEALIKEEEKIKKAIAATLKKVEQSKEVKAVTATIKKIDQSKEVKAISDTIKKIDHVVHPGVGLTSASRITWDSDDDRDHGSDRTSSDDEGRRRKHHHHHKGYASDGDYKYGYGKRIKKYKGESSGDEKMVYIKCEIKYESSDERRYTSGDERRRNRKYKGESSGDERRKKYKGESSGDERKKLKKYKKKKDDSSDEEKKAKKRCKKYKGESSGDERKKYKGESSGDERKKKYKGESSGDERKKKYKGESSGDERKKSKKSGDERKKYKGESSGDEKKKKYKGESSGDEIKKKSKGEPSGVAKKNEKKRDFGNDRDLDRDFGNDRDLDRDFGNDRDLDRDIEQRSVGQLQQVVNVYTKLAQSTELTQLREQNRGLFDSLLEHAVPFALNAAQSAAEAFSGKRDIGPDDIAIQQHLPTAINLAQQISSIPEVQANRGFFDKLFSVGMPLVLNTAQTLLGAKRGLESTNPEDQAKQRGFIDSVVGQLPATVLDVLSNSAGGNRDVGEDRGFFDILKKVAPIVLNVASSAVQSMQGQRSLAFVPTDRGFFDKIKKFVKKVVNNPIVKKIGGMALNIGLQVAKSGALGPVGKVIGTVAGGILGREVGQIAPPTEVVEAHVRGFFGSMLQTLTPIAMGAFQGAIGAIGQKRDIEVPQERGIFDILSKALPAVVQIAQTAFSQRRGVVAGESEAAYLQRVLLTKTAPLVAAAREQVATGVDRGILGSIIGDLLPF